MTKFLKLLQPFLSGICLLIYAVGWYNDVMFPAWVPLVWVYFVFINDLEEYFESR